MNPFDKPIMVMCMLEQFGVPHKDRILVSESALRKCVSELFCSVGISYEDASEAADVLVMSDLRGVESHGVSNMLRVYLEDLRSGRIKTDSVYHILSESAGTAVIDAERQLGIVMGPKAMRMAIKKAQKVGSAVVTVRNCGHMGAIGHHAMLAAVQNMIGLCMCTAWTPHLNVVPTFSSKPLFGTNPIAMAAPTEKEAPFLFDAATSTIAGNKIRLAMRVAAPLLPGWVSDKEGNPITEKKLVHDRNQFYLLPLGGTREQGSHKGYGFLMIAEILSSLLSGGLPYCIDDTGGAKGFFAAFDISAFMGIGQFKNNLDRMLKMLKETAPAEGHDRVWYPGLPEHEEIQKRRANGIPLHAEVIEWFRKTTAEMGVANLETNHF